MEIFVFIIIIIVAVIAEFAGYGSGISLRDERFDLNDTRLNLEDERVEILRDEYSRRLENYYSNKAPRFHLKNQRCELRLIKDGSDIYFYCKEKNNGSSKGRFFEVKGNNAHASTMWGIIDMEFNSKSSYSSILSLYKRLNVTMNSSGGLRFLKTPFFRKYPDYSDKYAQNEYCRMELLKEGNSVICSEIWSNNPNYFTIKGNKYLLLKIISDFKSEKNKFQTYSELLAIYSGKNGVTVETASEENINNKQSPPQQVIKPVEENKQNEPKANENITDLNNIKKYDERNVDF